MQILHIAQFLCLLAIASVCVAQDFKADFGEKFGEALKQYNAELIHSNMDGLKEFYETAIENFNLSARDERAFRFRLESIDAIKKKTGESVTPESVKVTSDFGKLVIFELLMFRASPQIAGDSAKSSLFDEAMQKSAQAEIKNINKFIENVQTKWKELYVTIPKEELEKHTEYKDINDSIDKVSKMDPSLSNALGRLMAFLDTFRKISSFFEYKEWNLLLLKNKP